tara:strand:- start:747 stop:890 length:144 start_codon:yes stop_codon:yes gene_type:complete
MFAPTITYDIYQLLHSPLGFSVISFIGFTVTSFIGFNDLLFLGFNAH